jgi:hypothetical protein
MCTSFTQKAYKLEEKLAYNKLWSWGRAAYVLPGRVSGQLRIFEYLGTRHHSLSLVPSLSRMRDLVDSSSRGYVRKLSVAFPQSWRALNIVKRHLETPDGISGMVKSAKHHASGPRPDASNDVASIIESSNIDSMTHRYSESPGGVPSRSCEIFRTDDEKAVGHGREGPATDGGHCHLKAPEGPVVEGRGDEARDTEVSMLGL